MLRRALRLLVLAFVLLPASVAGADDGPPRLFSATGPLRPVQTIDRLAASGRREVTLVAGGLGTDPRDHTAFQPLAERLAGRDVRYFGDDIGAYDTRGSLDVDADELAHAVRTLVKRDDVAAVSLVGHSQGTLVITEAFARGLGAGDNVSSAALVAGPARGATAARIVGVAAFATRPVHDDVDRFARRFTGLTPDDPAVRDLAPRRDASAPRDVRVSTIRALNDEVVFARDARVRGAEDVALLVGGEPHGGILRDRGALDAIAANVEGRSYDGARVDGRVARLVDAPLDAVRFVGWIVGCASIVAGVYVLRRFPWRPW